MIDSSPEFSGPRRTTDVARLQVARLRVDSKMSLGDIFTTVTERCTQTLEVERAGIWMLVDDNRILRCADLYESSKGLHSAGATLHVDDFPDYFAALARRKTVAAEVAKTDPYTSSLAGAYLVPLGITSMLDAAIFVSGEIVGVICHEHVGTEREWTTEARDFASSMADLLALKIRAAEVEELRSVLKTQDAQIAEAQHLKSLSQMAAGTAHDFNNILTVVSNYATLIDMDESASPAIAKSAQQIIDAAARGTRLVAELLSFAKPSRASVRVLRPAEFLRENLSYFQTAVGAKHSVRLDIRTDGALVFASPDQLHRAVTNLIINARDAMPEGGEIVITHDIVAEGNGDSHATKFAMIAVTDTGTGIPDELIVRIFDPFFTTKCAGKGTGLGLAIVAQTVRQTGGFVSVESAIDKGTTFRMHIPLASH